MSLREEPSVMYSHSLTALRGYFCRAFFYSWVFLDWKKEMLPANVIFFLTSKKALAWFIASYCNVVSTMLTEHIFFRTACNQWAYFTWKIALRCTRNKLAQIQCRREGELWSAHLQQSLRSCTVLNADSLARSPLKFLQLIERLGYDFLWYSMHF